MDAKFRTLVAEKLNLAAKRAQEQAAEEGKKSSEEIYKTILQSLLEIASREGIFTSKVFFYQQSYCIGEKSFKYSKKEKELTSFVESVVNEVENMMREDLLQLKRKDKSNYPYSIILEVSWYDEK
jgi:hypothetical protein